MDGPGTPAQVLRRNPEYRAVMAPQTLHHRYLQEGVPTGLLHLLEPAPSPAA